jgi:transposase
MYIRYLMKKVPPDETENMKEQFSDSEQKIIQLKEELEKERDEKQSSLQHVEKLKKEIEDLKKQTERLNERTKHLRKENKYLKKQLAQFQVSAPFLASSDKTSEAGGVPSSKTYYRRNRQEGTKKARGGQLGHIGHWRKKPTPNSPSLYVETEECPCCGTLLDKPVKGAEESRTITEIPVPKPRIFKIIYLRYWCKKCKKLVRGKVSWIPPNQEFGPSVASWIAYQRMLGLSIEKIQSSLYETYEIKMSEATILKLEKWVADTLKEDYDKLHEEIVRMKAVNADETGFRINGKNGWLWVFTSVVGSYYKVSPTRGHTVPEEILEGFEGFLGRDAWKPYDVVKCAGHQLDLLHVNRWLERAEIKHRIEPRSLLTSRHAKKTKPGRPPKKFLEFIDGIRSILKRAVEFTQKDPPPSMKERKNACEEFQKEMGALLDREWNDVEVIRISKELRKRQLMLFTFVKFTGVSWHNNDAERAIRKGVLYRKISGGRRTWIGAEVFEVILSIYETSKIRGKRFMEMLKEKFEMPTNKKTKNTSAS